jgi:hypothetical protein
MRLTTAARAAGFLALAAAAPAAGSELALGAFAGYQGGGAMRVDATVKKVVPDLPLAFTFGVGYAWRDPGDPLLARQVFVNQNTNGTPEESGHVWDYRLDVEYLFALRRLQEVGVFAGVRYSRFTGDFHYVGGNEDFEVVSNAWGWGAGVRGAFAMTPAWSLAVEAGFDHFPSWSVTGHDATYSSDGSSVNARADGDGNAYTSLDADQAVNQPKLVGSVLAGVIWRPGAKPPAAPAKPRR